MMKRIYDAATDTFEDVPLSLEETAARTPTLEQARTDKLAALAERRWQSQIGGTTLDTRSVKTDPTTTAMISSAYTKAVADPSYTVRNWKMDTGVFASLDAATIIAIGDAIEAHVQACFDQEAKLTTAIMLAKNVKALASIDIENGWPT